MCRPNENFLGWRVFSLSGGRNSKEFKIAPDEIAELLRWLMEEGKVGDWKSEKVRTTDGVEIAPQKCP